jgi:hypothetical protein
MISRLFTILSALSLLLGGYLIYRLAWPSDMDVIVNVDGRLVVHYGPLTHQHLEESARNILSSGVRKWEFAGFAYARNGGTADSTSVVGVPLIYLILATAVLPTLWWLHHRRSIRRGPGHCSNCGYDLRASPDRCPECGTEAKKPVANAGGLNRTSASG